MFYYKLVSLIVESVFKSYHLDRTRRVEINEPISYPLSTCYGTPSGNCTWPYTLHNLYKWTFESQNELQGFAHDFAFLKKNIYFPFNFFFLIDY